MVSKTRTMRAIKEKIKGILMEEELLCDMFNGLVDMGEMDDKSLSELRKRTENPTLYQDKIITLSKEEIMKNPYLENITVPYESSNNLRYTQRRLRPRTVTVYDKKKRDVNTLRQINSYFICDERLRFPGIIEGDNLSCWMTVEPIEINTFKDFIDEATGDVLLIGCGLGYVAYMLSRKEDVKSITVVDNNEDVLELFNTHILPQFENKDKIRTIKSDGIKYLKDNDLRTFDHINVDIWYDTCDMIHPYLKCLEIENTNSTVKFSYWLEDELKEGLQKSILCAISEFPTEELLINKIGEDIVRQTSIRTFEDIQNLIDIKDMRTLMYSWYTDNKSVAKTHEIIDTSRMNEAKEAAKMFIKQK